MQMTIAVLEDNEDRIGVMERYLDDKFPFYESRFFRSAGAAIDWLREHLDQTICLALDHDLERPQGEPDPGSGREVAEFLATNQTRFPIVIHTTNQHAAIAMEALLDDSGWTVSRVCPYGDLQWVSESWLPAVRAAIVAQAARVARSKASRDI